MKSGIYRIMCLANGRSYIGSSKNVHSRYRSHIKSLRLNLHPNKHLQRAWNKYGESQFLFGVMEYCDPQLLLDCEQKSIDNVLRSTLFNNHLTVRRGEVTDKTKAKFSGCNNPMHGKKHTAEARNKMKMNHAPRSGPANTNYDHTIYQFINKNTNTTFIGTRYQFYTKYNLCKVGVGGLVNNICTAYKGWTIQNL